MGDVMDYEPEFTDEAVILALKDEASKDIKTEEQVEDPPNNNEFNNETTKLEEDKLQENKSEENNNNKIEEDYKTEEKQEEENNKQEEEENIMEKMNQDSNVNQTEVIAQEEDEDQWRVKLYDKNSKKDEDENEEDKMKEDEAKDSKGMNYLNNSSNSEKSKDEEKTKEENNAESKKEKQTKQESSKKTKKPQKKRKDMLSNLQSSSNFSTGSGQSKRRTLTSVIAGLTSEEEQNQQHFAERNRARAEEQKLRQSKINRIVDESLKADRTLMLFNRRHFDSQMKEQIKKRKVKADEPSPFLVKAESESPKNIKRQRGQESKEAILADLYSKIEHLQ